MRHKEVLAEYQQIHAYWLAFEDYFDIIITLLAHVFC